MNVESASDYNIPSATPPLHDRHFVLAGFVRGDCHAMDAEFLLVWPSHQRAFGEPHRRRSRVRCLFSRRNAPVFDLEDRVGPTAAAALSLYLANYRMARSRSMARRQRRIPDGGDQISIPGLRRSIQNWHAARTAPPDFLRISHRGLRRRAASLAAKIRPRKEQEDRRPMPTLRLRSARLAWPLPRMRGNPGERRARLFAKMRVTKVELA